MNRSAAEIFHEARELPAQERASFLASACGADLALRGEVEALLKADAEAGRFMESPSREQPGAQIGRYKLLEQIGEGGMGTVWMAEQREPVKRRVALKIIKLGMDTRQVIARFEAERQALALMDHPHIAKVLDAGATETGRPYFVMEYIRGIPILEYCDQEKLDTRERLELFTNVCHAIQHAHQKGIIHRDIKPANILVTLHDGVPVPKVIDFGIAKATNAELTTKTLFTEHRQMIGTPSYMSPEQAEMSGLDIDTRSDIYSLGVLLYELLTGTTPFDMRDVMSKGFAEMMRVIREEEPHKPSTRVSTLGDTGTRTAQQRKVDLKRLGTLLRGDLDWIVMKCLEKSRTRRYETANGLAADIQRHLNDEPVTAGAPTAAYKLRKFVKRNRAQVIAAGLVVAALLIGVIAFAWQAKVARDQRDFAELAKQGEAAQRKLADEQRLVAEDQRKAAEAERDKATLIAEFMSDTLQGAGPSVAEGRDITMLREMMDAAAARIEKGDLKSAPDAELRLRSTIGDTYRQLAVFDAAQELLEPGVALARANHAGDYEATAGALNNFAQLLQARGDLAGAEPLFREALEMWRRLHPGDHRSLAAGIGNLASLLYARGDLAGAEPLFRESLEMKKRLFPGDHPSVATGVNNLASLLYARGDLAGAEQLYRESLEMTKRLFPGDHPDKASCLNNLASLLYARGDLAGAEQLYRESLEMTKRLFPGDHPDVARTLNNLALLLQARGDLAGAEPLFREALEMWRRLYPRDHQSVATGLNNLAGLLRARGDLAGAEPLYVQALEMRQRIFKGDHPDVLRTRSDLVALYLKQGKPDKSFPLIEDMLDVSRAKLPKDSPELAGELAKFGLMLLEAKAWGDAELLLRECLAIREAKAPDEWRTFSTGSMLGESLLGQKKLAEAESLLLDGYRGMKEREASIPPEAKVLRIPEALERNVQLYEAKGDATEAAVWRSKLEAVRGRPAKPTKDGAK